MPSRRRCTTAAGVSVPVASNHLDDEKRDRVKALSWSTAAYAWRLLSPPTFLERTYSTVALAMWKLKVTVKMNPVGTPLKSRGW